MSTDYALLKQSEKNVKKGIDIFRKGEYSSTCSAVEPQGERTERVPCKLNNEEQDKAPESGARDRTDQIV